MSPRSIRPGFVEIGLPRVTYREVRIISDAERGLRTSDPHLNRDFTPSHDGEPVTTTFRNLRLTIYQWLEGIDNLEFWAHPFLTLICLDLSCDSPVSTGGQPYVRRINT